MAKHKHILNLKALADRIKKPENTNAYHRINLIMKGGEFAATPELIDEVIEVIKTSNDKTIKFLKEIRKTIDSTKAA